MYTILGAGLSGLATADHLHRKGIPFQIFEEKAHSGGHIYSEQKDGFTWDEGPHISFTKSDYVKEYFAANCDSEFLEYPVNPTNYFEGSRIPHPAQTNLYAVPKKLRSRIENEIKNVRESRAEDHSGENYGSWLHRAFGETFAKAFPEAYTLKYWTTEPANLSTDWIGNRIYFPDADEMLQSINGPLNKATHYITKVRYPKTGGFFSFINKTAASIPVQHNKRLKRISFKKKEISFEDGDTVNYEKLISTIPLTTLIANSDAPAEIKTEAEKLKCSEVLIINVIAAHNAVIPNQWVYVYDENMYSTRVNFTELLSPNNGTPGKTGIQVEVYFSDYRRPVEAIYLIVQKVLDELLTMELIKSREDIESFHTKRIKFANVIFDNNRKKAQDRVLNWLSTKGLKRESDDLEPMTDWEEKNSNPSPLGDLILAGRFAQWKYYWTDDCVLRGKYISENIGA